MINRIFPPLPMPNGRPGTLVVVPLPPGHMVWIIEDYRDAELPEDVSVDELLELYPPIEAVAIAVPTVDGDSVAKMGAAWATPAYVLCPRRLTGTPVLGATIFQWIKIADDQSAAVEAYFNEYDARRTYEARLE